MAILLFSALAEKVQEKILRYATEQGMDPADAIELFNTGTANDQEIWVREAQKSYEKALPKTLKGGTPEAKGDVRTVKLGGDQGTPAATDPKGGKPSIAKGATVAKVAATGTISAEAAGVAGAASPAPVAASAEASIAAEVAGTAAGEGDDLKKLIDMLEDGKYAGRKATQRSSSAVRKWFVRELQDMGRAGNTPGAQAARALAVRARGLSDSAVLNPKFIQSISGTLDKAGARPLMDLLGRAHFRIGGIPDQVAKQEFKTIIALLKKVAPEDKFLIEQLEKLGPKGLAKVGARRGIETIGAIKEGGLMNSLLRLFKAKGPRPQVSSTIMDAASQARGAQQNPALINELAQKIPHKKLRGWVQKWSLAQEVIPTTEAVTDPGALKALKAAGGRVPGKVGGAIAAGTAFRGLMGAAGVGFLAYGAHETYDLIVGAKERAKAIRDSGINPATDEKLMSVGILKESLKRNEAIARRRQMLVSQPDLFAQVMAALGNEGTGSGDSAYRFGPQTESSYDKALGSRLGKSDYNARLEHLLSQMGG